MKMILSSSATALILATAGASAAATFAPATGDISVLGAPVVTLAGATSTASFAVPVAIYSTTGSLTSATGGGSVNGTLDFSDVVNSVTPETITDFMTFDSAGGSFFFNVASVQTLAFQSSAQDTAITLYLLGTAGGPGLTSSAASETLTINKTGASVYAASGSIDSPPAGSAPEPASWALMLVGFGTTGGFLRRARMSKTVGVV